MKSVKGLHHVTAVASNPQHNVNFYHHILGQRLVKTTVNFDDPGTYHLYYGDEVGTPGTILTFFPWLHTRPGKRGNGETAAVAYSIDSNAIGYWRDHLKQQGINSEPIEKRFNAEYISFNDPDGMRIELIANDAPNTYRFWQEGPIPQRYSLRGFFGVTLWVTEVESTARLLTDQLGYILLEEKENRYRFKAASNYIDLLYRPGQPPAEFGAGSIHHIAFRTANDQQQNEYQQTLRTAGFSVTPVRDRQYFRSIYFHSPAGVLFEIATDDPGFLYDEAIHSLGTRLKLPPWLEPKREGINKMLPDLKRKPVQTNIQEDIHV